MGYGSLQQHVGQIRKLLILLSPDQENCWFQKLRPFLILLWFGNSSFPVVEQYVAPLMPVNVHIDDASHVGGKRRRL